MAALLPVLLTVGAVAAEPYFGLGDLKAIGPGHLPEDSVGQGAGGLNDAAEEVLLRAIELDPNFAEAYELLARKHWNLLEQQQAQEVAAKALAIDPDLVLAQAVYQSAKIGSHLAGIEAFEQALRKQIVELLKHPTPTDSELDIPNRVVSYPTLLPDKSFEKRAQEVGCNEYMVKPLDLDTLTQLLEKFVTQNN